MIIPLISKVLVLVLLMCIPLQWHKIEFWRLQRSRADCSRPKSAIVRQTIHRVWTDLGEDDGNQPYSVAAVEASVQKL